jgi:hypothetical protein
LCHISLGYAFLVGGELRVDRREFMILAAIRALDDVPAAALLDHHLSCVQHHPSVSVDPHHQLWQFDNQKYRS